MSNAHPTWLAPLLYLLGAGTMLGASTILGKLAAEVGISPMAFLTWSVAAAAALLGALQWSRGDLPRTDAASLRYLLIAGLLSVALSYFIIYASIPRVGAGFVSLTLTFAPVLTYLGALAVRMERFRQLRAIGVALALAGGGVLAFHKLSAPDATGLWIGLALCGPLVLAAGNLYRTADWPAGTSPEALAPGMLAAAALLLVLGAVAANGMDWGNGIFSLAVPLNKGFRPFYLLAAQTLTVGGQFLLFFLLQRAGGPVYLSLVGSVSAVIAIPIAVLVLGEGWPEGLLLGGALVLGGISLMTYDAR